MAFVSGLRPIQPTEFGLPRPTQKLKPKGRHRRLPTPTKPPQGPSDYYYRHGTPAEAAESARIAARRQGDKDD
jgi:hypothetical protein